MRKAATIEHGANEMRTKTIFALTLMAGSLAAVAQTNTAPSTNQLGSDARPASSNVPGQQYPQVDSERHAAFRLSAANAGSVQLDIGGHQYDMTKNGQSQWSVTTPPLVVGFHYYSFIVDGVSVADPASEAFFGVSKMMSGIEVPSPGEDFYLAKDVPHGEVREHWYYSKTNSAWRRCYVYTPPGYLDNQTPLPPTRPLQPPTRYPVLYLQHGAGEDETGWSIQGHVNYILDNLIAEGKAKPMIVVMDNGGGSAAFAVGARGGRGRGAAGVMGAPAGTNAPGGTNQPGRGGPSGGRGGGFGGAANLFTDTLLHEIIPIVDSTYRTIPDREHRAMAGLSMGAGQTFQIVLNHPETFSAMGAFSGGANGVDDLKTAYNGIFADAGAFNKKIKVMFFSMGTAENLAAAHNLDKLLTDAHISHVYYESPGTAHEWQSWRRSLHEFAPLLFQTP
jgi:enterochelin esterase family protein